MMSVMFAGAAVMYRQSKSTADRTVLEALCLQAFEDLIHKYSSKMHKETTCLNVARLLQIDVKSPPD